MTFIKSSQIPKTLMAVILRQLPMHLLPLFTFILLVPAIDSVLQGQITPLSGESLHGRNCERKGQVSPVTSLPV